MAYITGKTRQGCCMPVRYANGVYECEPDVGEFFRYHRIFNDYHIFYAKITGDIGETITVRLNWPKFDPEAVSDEYKAWSSYSAKWDSMMLFLEDVLYFSSDEIHWKHIKNVTREENSLLFTLTLTEGVGYLCTPMRYSCTAYEALKNDLAKSELVQCIPLGQGWDGGVLETFVVSDPTVAYADKKTIYLQAVQHCHEHTGGHVLDAVLRFLTAGSDEARALLRRYVFRITPVVDVTGWRYGAEITPHRKGTVDSNPNRDWGVHAIPETRVLAAYLEDLAKAGERFAFFGDLHGGGGTADVTVSGPNGIFLSMDGTPEQVEECRRFIRMVTCGMDCYMNPDQGLLPEWQSHEEPTKFTTYVKTRYGAPAYTFELAHQGMWDKAAGKRIPNTRERYRRFAEQFLRVIDRYITEK